MAFGMSPFPLRFGSRQGGVAPPQLIWFDDFSTYASTAEMLAAGWVDASSPGGSIALDAERLALLPTAGTARAERAVSGYVLGARIRATWTLSASGSVNQVAFLDTSNNTLLSGDVSTGTHSITYITTTSEMKFMARRNTAAATYFFDEILIENLGPF